MKRIILPLLLTLAFYLESIFVDLLPPEAFGGERIVVPHFLLILLIIMGIYYVRNHALLYAALFGLLFDVYYTEIIGIYLFLFPISVYLASKMMRILHINIFTTAIVLMIQIAFVEILVYIFNVFVFSVSIIPSDFATTRLLPTLILNIACFILIFFPFSRFLLNKKKIIVDELS
ncbi:rod shape-determining protein MreD [Bacillus sp. FSL K6-3431]|uniref:rod shape-determining protein MreD n=1 Tax=Bacillus sp. FSL K6-3431 TaxID=2921500 RepID=UPI0030F4C15F